ncbi:hypothetical protein J3459_006132 [Metarhizium acridum]|nr:hypothetical protein J3459_006132 [Metarhizium acridum]
MQKESQASAQFADLEGRGGFRDSIRKKTEQPITPRLVRDNKSVDDIQQSVQTQAQKIENVKMTIRNEPTHSHHRTTHEYSTRLAACVPVPLVLVYALMVGVCSRFSYVLYLMEYILINARSLISIWI